MGKIIYFKTKEDKPMLNILDVARYLLTLGSMNHKKLQKLCFYIQAWYFAITNQKLIDTEFQAWAHGPVSPNLFDNYQDWKSLTIPQITYTLYDINISDWQKDFIKAIYNLYKDYSADELEWLTHQEEPWREARGDVPDGEACTAVISDESIRTYYKRFLHTNDE